MQKSICDEVVVSSQKIISLIKLKTMPITDSEVVKESRVKINIIEIRKEQKPSRNGGNYTLAHIVDQDGRKITACGQWIENMKEGDNVEGILQEKVSTYIKDALSDGELITSLYLENPRWR